MANVATYLPALKCFVGDRYFYASSMTFSQVSERVMPSDQLVTSKALDELIQRTLTDRSKEIARYIETQGQRFFNSLVLAVFEGEPEWLDIRLLDSDFLPTDIDEAQIDRFNSKIGLLRLSGAEQVFALDGQHRVEGIKQALRDHPELGDQEVSVLLISHRAGDEGKERTRRLFTTLNRYARPVSKYEKIALDEDDALAIVTRRLLNDHPALGGTRTAYSKTSSILPSNRVSLTTLPVVYDIASLLVRDRNVGGETWTTSRIAYPRPSDEKLDLLFATVSEFWDELARWSPEFALAAAADDRGRTEMNMRSRDGGGVVFRPIMQLALAGVVRQWIDRGESISDAFGRLSAVPRQLTDEVWRKVIWDPVGRKMIATNEAKGVTSGLLLFWSAYPVDRDTVLAKYRSLMGEPDLELPGL
jgi:DNA sulfur modification protein DndB